LIIGCAVVACASSRPKAGDTPAAPVPPTPTIAFDKSVSEAIEATNGGIVEAAVADRRLWLRTRSGVMAVRFADGGMEEHFPLGIVDLHRTRDGQLWILGAQKDGNAVLEVWNSAWTDAIRVAMDNPKGMGELNGWFYVVSARELSRTVDSQPPREISSPEWKTVALSETLHVGSSEVVTVATAHRESIYVGSETALYRIDPASGHVTSIAGHHATALIRDPELGACVLAADGPTIVRVCGDHAEVIKTGNEPFHSFAQTGAGLFVSTSKSILRLGDQRELDIPHFRRTGGVWIGTGIAGLLVIPSDDGILLAPL
jgi:hypothetical protein